MPQIQYRINFETKEERDFIQQQMHHIKYKTGENFPEIIKKALKLYNDHVRSINK